MRRNHVSSNPVFHWRTKFLPTRYCHGSVWTPLITRNSVPAKVNISFFPEKSSGYSFKLFSTVTFFFHPSLWCVFPTSLSAGCPPGSLCYLIFAAVFSLMTRSQHDSLREVFPESLRPVCLAPLLWGCSRKSSLWGKFLASHSDGVFGSPPQPYSPRISLNDYFCDPSLTECLGIFLSVWQRFSA